MQITLNNNPETIEAGQITVRELLNLKRYTFKMLIVKINGQVVKNDEYDNAIIRDGDQVVVLHLISGG